MTPHTEILIVFPKPRPSREAVHAIHQWLIGKDARVEVGENCYYCLGEVEGYEYDCHDTWDAEATLGIIAAWPQAGFLHYNILGTSFLVSYKAQSDFALGGIHFSAWEPEYQWNPDALDALFLALHAELGRGILMKGDNFTDEVSADDLILSLQNGTFEEEHRANVMRFIEKFQAVS